MNSSYRKLFLILMTLLFTFVLSNQTEAFTLYFKDGTVIQNVSDIKKVGDLFLYKIAGKNKSVFAHKVSKILDDNGNIYYEPSYLFYVRYWNPSINEYTYSFKKNNKIIATGHWDENDHFIMNGLAQDGIYNEYYDSGVLRSTLSVSNNNLNGVCKFYYETGILRREGTFVNGKEEGTSKLYNNTGNIEGVSEYKNGKKNGITKLFYKSGNIKAILQYKDGKVKGIQKTFYKSGQKQTIVNFSNGVRNGPIEEYYESGKLMMKGVSVDDNLNGQVIQYYESGRIKSSKLFDNGKLVK